MNIFKKNYKILIFFLILILFIFNYSNLKNSNFALNVKEYLKTNLSSEIFIFFQVLGDPERTAKKVNNDYNIFFLPETQILKQKQIKLAMQNI